MNSYIKNFFKSTNVFNFNVLNRNAWVAEQAKYIFKDAHVLDAGAGSCPYKELFLHCIYKSQDFVNLQDKQLSGKAYGDIDYICDIADIPVQDSSFDVVLCSEVLEHLPEPIFVLKEFSRILKSGGKLLITAPLGSGIHQEPFHFYGGYTPYWYEKFLSDSGFTNITIEENSGSIRSCAQEAMRFMSLSSPFKLKLPIWLALLWVPVWILLVPAMSLVAPFAGYFLDKYDNDSRFTIGYHVTAQKI